MDVFTISCRSQRRKSSCALGEVVGGSRVMCLDKVHLLRVGIRACKLSLQLESLGPCRKATDGLSTPRKELPLRRKCSNTGCRTCEVRVGPKRLRWTLLHHYSGKADVAGESENATGAIDLSGAARMEWKMRNKTSLDRESDSRRPVNVA